MTKEETIEHAQNLFNQGFACSQAILGTFAPSLNINFDSALLVSAGFGGGMGRLRQKCGALTGGFMVLSLAFGNTNPKDLDTRLFVYKKVRLLNQNIELVHHTTNCAELLKQCVNENEIIERKHHKLICSQIVGEVAGLLYDMLENDKNV